MRSQRREPELRKDGEHGAEAATLKLRGLTEKATPLIHSCRPNSTPQGQSVLFLPSRLSARLCHRGELPLGTVDNCSLRQNHKAASRI